ncbi:glutamine synthetase, type I [Candidatus Methanoperedens nitroreducens]|uniref:Glutamine synthetase n=1 Tax=Candidatus Methanoperedens nitratireducens TaxID=1392998 RepID=A0A062V8W5_9EURY|nr:type I glutamate--ammonia ligase [Candidatus Methanoperedens nitroreducens]KCZ72953.1 glutamine synthetase, type I [Candidatus Methanoperedens nitroreducens]MDJ1423103.1 type I glutamate--ammonia ligase [Candidatus Methanoperedens sp.]
MIKTNEDVLNSIEEDKVRFLRLQFVDIQGMIKNVGIPVSQAEKALKSGISFDGSSIEGFVRIEESDMVLKPDISTYRILPWDVSGGKVARIICDVYKPNGKPFEGDPRYVLKRAMKEAEKLGFVMNTGPEIEFFLFERKDGEATNKPHDFGGYFDFPPIDRAEEIRQNIVVALENMGFNIEASHHEVSAGQHEIDFKYADALTTADNVITFKFVTKTIARMNHLHASFMPKPVFGINGSGMHTNISLFSGERNALYDEMKEHEVSDTLRYFIGGLKKHVKSFTAITNPIVNSYKRIVPGYEAPVYVAWSWANRSSLIRIPAARGLSTRIELRSPDPSCNPYLSFAVILMAGLDGIENQIDPGEPTTHNLFHLNDGERGDMGIESLPGNLKDALDHLETDIVVRDALGDHVFRDFMRLGRAEWDAYRVRVHQWELDRYLNIV